MGSANTDWSTDDFRQHIAGELKEHAHRGARPHATPSCGCSASSPPTSPGPRTSAADRRRPSGHAGLPRAAPGPVPERAAGAGGSQAARLGRGGDREAVRHRPGLGASTSTSSSASSCPSRRSSGSTTSSPTSSSAASSSCGSSTASSSRSSNAVHVEQVDISWLESLTLEGRASYYDRAGALKDMVQNHLMEAMALVAHGAAGQRRRRLLPGRPRRGAAGGGHARRAERMRSDTVRARYAAGTIGARQVPSYVDEPGVDPSRNTETYASLTLGVDSPRWAGVPFTLRSGKALETDSAEIAIHFRPLPRYLLDRWPGVEPNVLRLGLTEPYVRLATTIKRPDRRPSREARAPSDSVARIGLRQPDPRDAPKRPDAVHSRRRGRGGMARHRPRDEGVVGRRRPDAGVRGRHSATGPVVLK